MKKCQFWKMSSLKGKSKCQRDRYFIHRERCLLGVTQKGVRIIFFPSWNELQLPGIKHTKQYTHIHTRIAWRGAWSLFSTLLRKSEKESTMKARQCGLLMSQGKIETLLCCNRNMQLRCKEISFNIWQSTWLKKIFKKLTWVNSVQWPLCNWDHSFAFAEKNNYNS